MSRDAAISPALFLSLLGRFSFRYWRRHWLKLALLVGIVGLGTGSFLAIGLANRAATASFDRFAQTVSGQSQAVLTPSLGDFSLQDLKAMRRALLDTEATLVPQLIVSARVADRPDLPFDETVFSLIGMDLLAASNFLARFGAEATFWSNAETASDDPDLPDLRNGLYAQPETAQRFGWRRGHPIPLVIGDRVVELPWAGPLPQLDADLQAAANVLVLDWQTLSDLTGQPIQASRVDLLWMPEFRSEAAIDAALAKLEQANPGNWVIESQAERQATGETMTLALRMNLRALSALSLLVAICLVFQAMDSAVARRQAEVATLRSLGVSQKLTQLLWLSDSALLGMLGGAAGLALGAAMASVSTQLVTRTVNTIYYDAGSPSLAFSFEEAAVAWGLTVAFCLLAGWWPARQAARSPLVETIRRGNHRSTYSRKAYLLAAALFALAAVAAYFLPPIRSANGHAIPVGGYALAIFLIGFVAAVACLCLESAGSLCRRLGARLPSLRVALSQFRLPVTRHRLALSGVTLSVGMTAAMVFLIGSFESTVRSWIASTLQADLFIRSQAASHHGSSLSPDLVEQLRSDPRVSDSAVIYGDSVRIDGLVAQLVGFDTEYLHRIDHTTWIDAPDSVLALQNGQTAIVNEAFANRFQKRVGDAVTLSSRSGETAFRVIGIYAEYGNENGSVGIDAQAFIELTGDRSPQALALHAKSPESIPELARSIENARPGLNVMTNRWLREESLRIFNRVFSITYALEAIGLAISIAGLGSMLASLLIERRSETSALIRIGFDPQRISLSALWEGLCLALLGVAAGLALGFLLGLVLVFIINRQSFGWTLAVSIPWPALAALGALTVVGAGIVSFFVGRWSARQPLVSEE